MYMNNPTLIPNMDDYYYSHVIFTTRTDILTTVKKYLPTAVYKYMHLLHRFYKQQQIFHSYDILSNQMHGIISLQSNLFTRKLGGRKRTDSGKSPMHFRHFTQSG